MAAWERAGNSTPKPKATAIQGRTVRDRARMVYGFDGAKLLAAAARHITVCRGKQGTENRGSQRPHPHCPAQRVTLPSRTWLMRRTPLAKVANGVRPDCSWTER